MYRTHVLPQFDELGYAVLENVLDPEEDLVPIIQDYDALLDALAERWQREGLIPSTYAGLPFEQRFARVALDAGKAGINWIQYFDFSYPQGGLTADTPDSPERRRLQPAGQSQAARRGRKAHRAGDRGQPDPPCAAQTAGSGGARGAARRPDGAHAVAPGSGRGIA